MNQQIKKLWIDALRSGEFRQGKSRLRSSIDKFCCLGVLCELHRREKGLDWSNQGYDDSSHFSYDSEASFLSEEMIEWAGLKSKNPSVKISDRITLLSTLNDGGSDKIGTIEPLPFNKIADLIEEQL